MNTNITTINGYPIDGRIVAQGTDIWYTTPKDKVKWRRYVRCFVRDYGSYYGPVIGGVDYSTDFGRIAGSKGLYSCSTTYRTIYFRFRKVRGKEETKVWWWVVSP